jgi:hypothetical protein
LEDYLKQEKSGNAGKSAVLSMNASEGYRLNQTQNAESNGKLKNILKIVAVELLALLLCNQKFQN